MRYFWHKWHYKHLTYMVLSCVIIIGLVEFGPLHQVVPWLADTGILGAVLGGLLFISAFTVALGTVMILALAETMPTWQLALAAGLGGVIGDLIVFKLIRSQLQSELMLLFFALGGKYWKRLFKLKILAWTLPVLGAAIIASPFPDEIGIGLMGFTKLKAWQFALLVFGLNTLGIWLIATTVQVIN